MSKQIVCEASELPPGAVRRFDHAGNHYAVGNDGGALFAMDGVCSHRGGELYAGTLQDGCLVCPLHHARFDVRTGKVGPPPPVATDLSVFSAAIEDGHVVVELPEAG